MMHHQKGCRTLAICFAIAAQAKKRGGLRYLGQSPDELLDLIGEDESSPLMSLVDILSDWIEAYDLEHRPMPVASGVDVLRSMMREHGGLNQSDLPGVGTQSVVSEVLER